MNYGYIRVSTDKQTVENQRYEINRFCEREKVTIHQWIEETTSGTKEPDKRKLGKVLSKLEKGDILICAELSRLGRSLLMIMDILNQCLKREVQVWTIKDNYRLGIDISSKVLAFAFGLSAEIERNLISQRTKEALARRRAEGVILGRPRGRKSSHVKLTGREDEIARLLHRGFSQSRAARRLRVHRITLSKFLREHSRFQSPENAIQPVHATAGRCSP
ncbi:MAG TPA: master DNA invertase Mpi family serine-type recombinase [Verrucomicrobiae bacterium]|jgi:DNA invertase Pin-like site-specific DNA recombinase|nr:master DNA invertase Mpi family serine-type recombinase [Verrucomicrobiae bacterium]